jgi:hypothetical protein
MGKRDGLVSLLKEFFDVFALKYTDMLGLDTNIVVYMLFLIDGCKPMKQKLRRMRLDILTKVKEEVKKQWDALFIEVVKYP